jgi:enoyl-CoA hydratase
MCTGPPVGGKARCGSLFARRPLERRVFHAAFATADQKEGMTSFIEKRSPGFVHR